MTEWLEVEVGFPDGHRDVTRRALADRAGTAWRQAGKPDADQLRPLVRDADGLTHPKAVHNIWFSAGGHKLAAYAEALQLLAHWRRDIANQSSNAPQNAESSQGSAAHPTFGEMVWPFAMANFGFLVRSDHAVVPALNDSPSIRFYADSPRILIVSVGSTGQAGGAGGVYFQGDLRRDQVRGLARETSAEGGVVERKIWYGVLQGALEHETAVEYALASGVDPATVISTSDLLTAEGVVALRPTASSALPPTMDREAAAQVSEALARGATLLLPRAVVQGGRAAWWEIAPTGADTRAVLAENPNTAGFNISWGGPGSRPAPIGTVDVGPAGPVGQKFPPRLEPPLRPPGVTPKFPEGDVYGPQQPPGPAPRPPLEPPDQIGPLLPNGEENPKCKAGGQEYVGTTGCISTPAATTPAYSYAPLLMAGAAILAIVVGFMIGGRL